MAKRPMIAITMRLEAETGRFYLGRDYSEVLEACGATPLHMGLIPRADYISEVLAGADGVLLPGSNTDVDPLLYGEEPHQRLGTVIPEKDETDRLVLDWIEKANIPLLAICYGMQALNVRRGGSLVQDIAAQVPESIKHEQGLPSTRRSHSINIADTCFLQRLSSIQNAEGPVRVNSSHHQAVKKVGANLKAIAWAADGVIEAIEDTRDDRFAVGVQWHPELTARSDRFSLEIFEAFVEKCRQG